MEPSAATVKIDNRSILTEVGFDKSFTGVSGMQQNFDRGVTFDRKVAGVLRMVLLHYSLSFAGAGANIWPRNLTVP